MKPNRVAFPEFEIMQTPRIKIDDTKIRRFKAREIEVDLNSLGHTLMIENGRDNKAIILNCSACEEQFVLSPEEFKNMKFNWYEQMKTCAEICLDNVI